MRWMLDTGICIDVINERPSAVLQAFREHEAEGLGISSVTAAELFYGVARTGSQRNLDALRRFLAPLEIAAFDAAAAEVCGSLRAWLAAQGTPIGPYDTQIAAHAHAIGVALVRNHTREFARVPACAWRTGRQPADHRREAAAFPAARAATSRSHCVR